MDTEKIENYGVIRVSYSLDTDDFIIIHARGDYYKRAGQLKIIIRFFRFIYIFIYE